MDAKRGAPSHSERFITPLGPYMPNAQLLGSSDVLDMPRLSSRNRSSGMSRRVTPPEPSSVELTCCRAVHVRHGITSTTGRWHRVSVRRIAGSFLF